jgi:hypothetical protein
MSAFEFTVREGEPLTVKTAVFEALGAASMAWEYTPQGVFDSERAKEIGDALLAFLKEPTYAGVLDEVGAAALLLPQIEAADVPRSLREGPLSRENLIATAAQAIVMLRGLEGATIVEDPTPPELDEDEMIHHLEPTA